MSKPPIEYRPEVVAKVRELRDVMVGKPSEVEAALEAYKASERAKVLARVRKHRARKRGIK